MKHRLKKMLSITIITAISMSMPIFSKVYDADEEIEKMLGKSLGKTTVAARSAALEKLARTLKSGDALILPTQDFGEVDFTEIANDIEISGGKLGKIYMGGSHSDMAFIDNEVPILLSDKSGRTLGKLTNSLFWNNVNSGSKSNIENSAFIEEQIVADPAKLETSLWGKVTTYSNIRNTAFLYFSYNIGGSNCGTGIQRTDPMVIFGGPMTNSRVYHMVETTYGMKVPSVIFQEVQGPFHFLVGDTERPGPATEQYKLIECSKVVLGTHRLYGGTECNSGCPDIGFYAEGGEDNCFFYSQEISKSKRGLVASNEKNLQVWGMFTEMAQEVPEDALVAFCSPNGYGADYQWCNKNPGKQGAWHEPVEIQDEIIFKYKGVDLSNPDNSGSVTPPKPPEFMPTNVAKPALGKMMQPRYLNKARRGTAVLAAGADPTGKRPSDQAFAKVLQSQGRLELPEGIFLINSTIELDVDYADNKGLDKLLEGAGERRTVVRMARKDIPAVKFVSKSSGLHKTANLNEDPDQKLQGISDVTIDGGKWGIDLTCFYKAAMRFVNVTITNSSQAGIVSGDGKFDNFVQTFPGCENNKEFDQNRFINVKCINTGDYGFFSNLCMIDKQFFLNCHFENLNKAGIAANFTHMWNASVLQCTFKNINGPGLDVYTIHSQPGAGGKHDGYTPHCSSIESCEFIECGSETRGAIDFGWIESGSITNSKVIIKNKPWKFAIQGVVNICQNVIIDVDGSKMIDGGAAVALRHNRRAHNSRTTGSVLHKVTGLNGEAVNGPIAFVNDVNSIVDMDRRFPGQYEGYEWAYPNMLIDSKFSNADCEYAIANTNKNGGLKSLIPIAGTNQIDDVIVGTKYSIPAMKTNLIKKELEFMVYTISGREIMNIKGSDLGELAHYNLPKGLYVLRSNSNKIVRHLTVR